MSRTFLTNANVALSIMLMAKKKNPAAVALGRKGGKARKKALTQEQLSDAARKAVQARWAKQKPEGK